MPLDVGRVSHLVEQMHRSEDDAGDPITDDFVLAADGARGLKWVDPGTLGGGIPESILDAKGDLIVASAADTAARLPVGASDGDILTVDSGETLGMKWASAARGLGTNWFNVEDYGAVHDATGPEPAAIASATDDTAAIQAAIDACMTASGGIVYFPRGVYAIKGALQDTSVCNAQLVIPQNSLSGSNPPVVIEFIGEGPTGQWNHGTQGGWDPGNAGAVLVSDWAGTISGEPAVISATKYDTLYPAAGFNWLEVAFRNIEVRCPDNPKLSGIQMFGVASLSLENVTVCINSDSTSMTVPTNANTTAVIMPARINANQPCSLENVFVDGYYTGFKLTEVAYGGTISANHCIVGQEFIGPQDHANHFNRILNVAVKTSLKFTGGNIYLTVQQLDIEHSSDGNFGRVYDVDDGSNYAHGFVWWHTVLRNTGSVDDDLTVNGGANLNTISITSGSITGGGGAPTTADYLVGTANGSLSAEIVVGTSPGGELGGTWASPTVDTTHSGTAHADFIAKAIVDAKGDIIAATAADTVARVPAGTDGHVLTARSSATPGVAWEAPTGGSTGIGPILISDTPSTPLVFADLIQNEAQTDLVYADP